MSHIISRLLLIEFLKDRKKGKLQEVSGLRMSPHTHTEHGLKWQIGQ
jgi:hypothetical protein